MTRTPMIRALLLATALAFGAPAAMANPHAELMPKLAKGGPLAHVAMTELKDKAGKVLKPTDLVATHTGKKVTAAEYLKQLNAVKKQINAAGHKLRSGRPYIQGSMKIDQGTGARRKAIAAAHAAPFEALRPMAERIARFTERVGAIHNPKLAADPKFQKAFPNFVKHLNHAGK